MKTLAWAWAATSVDAASAIIRWLFHLVQALVRIQGLGAKMAKTYAPRLMNKISSQTPLAASCWRINSNILSGSSSSFKPIPLQTVSVVEFARRERIFDAR